MTEKIVTVRVLQDRTLERKTETGWEKIEIPVFDPALLPHEPVYDPENPPLTDEQLKRMRRISLAKRLRIRLGLTRTDFAERFRIPVGTLRDWEQHRTEPDAPANALLHLIAVDPEWTAEKLRRMPETATA